MLTPMYLKFKGLPDLFKKFPDDAAARHYFEAQRWQGCPVCPFCGSMDYYKLNDGKTYKCATKTCYKKYTVTVGTPLHGSPIGLHIWFAGMYLLSSHKWILRSKFTSVSVQSLPPEGNL